MSATSAFDGLVFIDLCSEIRYDRGISERIVPIGGTDLADVKAAASMTSTDAMLNDLADACCVLPLMVASTFTCH